MIDVRGPGTPFTTLFDEQVSNDRTLPESFARVYSPWPLPDSTDLPFTYVNFVMSHDGRVSFNTPGHLGGGDVSRRDAHDRWLMGLLRSRADAVLVGGSSIEAAGNHVWTPGAVFPDDAEAFATLRESEGRAPVPLLVVMTRSGTIPAHAPSLDNPDLPVLIVTTTHGAKQVQRILGERAWVRYLDLGETLDQRVALRTLRQEYAINHLLSEAGPQVYGSLLHDRLINDAFVTMSPVMIGEAEKQPRPSLIEGTAFGYDDPPRLTLLSVHRHGSYLYLHSRYESTP